jgi:hypothetical protein
MRPSYAELTTGRRLLKTLLPMARERHSKGPVTTRGFEAVSAPAKAVAPWFRIDNIEAILIFEAPLGGWIADFLLKETPPGVPNVMGTPVGTPHATRQQAQDYAVSTMAALMATKPYAEAPPGFSFHGWGVKLDAYLLGKVVEHFPRGAYEGYSSVEAGFKRLHEMEEQLFPGGDVTAEKIDALDRDERAVFLSVLHIAALTGIFRYPAPEPGTLSGHKEHGTKQ